MEGCPPGRNPQIEKGRLYPYKVLQVNSPCFGLRKDHRNTPGESITMARTTVDKRQYGFVRRRGTEDALCDPATSKRGERAKEFNENL
ncbi:hypothetical protein EVAR_52674_1 [Eumeta japonica]|uniref:Uncharacterized protein n=1 Tax=Eumeta variegata TaxID=151549 RepID=A0A4C1ZN99_EUMVA|nr:hypothetical protein EVAR_52674_1 [Eumeta japonica]